MDISIVSTNAAALASQKADEAIMSANIAKGKVEEIVKQKLSENFNDTKQVNTKVVTKEIIKELEKVMSDENK